MLRDKIADLGLDVRDVTEVIETAVAGSRAGEFRVAGNSYASWCNWKTPSGARSTRSSI